MLRKAFSYFFHELAAAAAFAASPADDEQLQVDMRSAQGDADAVASAATVGPAGLGENAPRWAARIREEQPAVVPTEEALVRQDTVSKNIL